MESFNAQPVAESYAGSMTKLVPILFTKCREKLCFEDQLQQTGIILFRVNANKVVLKSCELNVTQNIMSVRLMWQTCRVLRDMWLIWSKPSFLLMTSRDLPFSGPFFIGSRPIRYKYLPVRMRSLLHICKENQRIENKTLQQLRIYYKLVLCFSHFEQYYYKKREGKKVNQTHIYIYICRIFFNLFSWISFIRACNSSKRIKLQHLPSTIYHFYTGMWFALAILLFLHNFSQISVPRLPRELRNKTMIDTKNIP